MNDDPHKLFGLAEMDLVRAGESIGLATFEISGPKYVVKAAPPICIKRGYVNFKEGYMNSLAYLKSHIKFVGADPAWRLEIFWVMSADNPFMDTCCHRIVCYRNYVNPESLVRDFSLPEDYQI
jgi:hypothetical protein